MPAIRTGLISGILALVVVTSATGARSSVALPSVVDLATASGVVRVDGPASGAGFGTAGLAVGDLDGDGAADLVVAAPQAEGGRGAVYCVFGGPSGLGSRNLASQPADLTIVGAGTNVGLGVAVALVDLDADGATELAVSTKGFLPVLGRLASGGVLVFRGGGELRARGRIDLATELADAAVVDSSLAVPVGAALVAGDFDGDFYDDLAVGSPASPGFDGAANAGRVFVAFGGAFEDGRIFDAATDTSMAVIGGRAETDKLGTDLAVGDLNGDRVVDLVAGAPNRTVIRAVTFQQTGTVFVLAGGALGRGTRIDLAETEAALEVLGSDYGDYLGHGIGTGDVTGDGVADLAVGAITGDGPMNARYPDCGEVYVVASVAGSTSSRVVDLMDRTQWLWVIGKEPYRFLGNTLAVGDFDGDRRAEVVASSQSAPGPNGGAGALYVVRGEPGTLDLASGQPETTVVGPSTGARLGTALVAADVNGDGVSDIVTSAPFATGGRGSVYVVAGVRSVADAGPVLAPVSDVVVQTGQTRALSFSATDADGDPISFSVFNRPAGSTFVDAGDGTARLSITLPADATGAYEVRVVATDGQLTSAATFAITVTDGPVPSVTKAAYKNGALRLRGENFGAAAELIVNGERVERPVVVKAGGRRIVGKGTREELNLLPTAGANYVVVLVDGVASAPFTF